MFGKKKSEDTQKQAPKLPRCEYCGQEFIPAHKKQKFCSDAHRQAAWREQQRQAAR